MAQSTASFLEAHLWPAGLRRDVWMVLDSARDPRIFSLLLASYLEYSCLYSGVLPVSLENAAPYLVHLEFEERRTRYLLEQAWGNSWGIFLKCDTRLQTLRTHLRSLLTVRHPSGGKLLFRYYDPRVLRLYLPTCSSGDLRTVFGPIERIFTEGESPQTIVECGFNGATLVRSQLSIHAKPARQASLIEAANSAATERHSPGMLGIRREQLVAFSRDEANKFEDWMVAHANRFFQPKCGAIGESKLREVIRYGIHRAGAYGLKAKRDVCKYIDVMLALGRDFDSDVRFPWVPQILAQQAAPGTRAQTLLQAAVNHLKSL